MKLRLLTSFLCLFSILILSAQNKQNDVLFTVGDVPVYTSEFVSVYNKNLELVKDETQKDIDGYLKLFINYKLKLQEARALGLDKKPVYLREFKSYKNQLSKNYLTDNKVTDALVEEAYDRMGYEIDASHVLVRIDESASPKDTLSAYNEILKLRDRVLKEGYKVVQRDVHNGKTIFAEDLGYFSAFKMVYDFENAAFNTKIGEVSQPFRTQFGYHVVKILDKRKSRGEVTVAHIMLNNDETKANDIYKRIEQGEDFEALAKQFSEDKSSSAKGGMLNPFTGGQLSSKTFEDVAFGLKEKGEVSKPFKSEFGWHIVKLYGKKNRPPLKDARPELQTKIKRDSRSKLINTSRVNALKGKYKVTENKSGLAYFKSIVNNDYLQGRWRLPKDFDGDKVLLSIEDKSISNNDFGQYLIKMQRRSGRAKNVNGILDYNYNQFFEGELLKFQEENLEFENKDFAQILNEYREGLLLFDLMETEIWNAADTDSLAIKDFYEANKSNYFFEERIDAVVASSAKKATIKKVAKLLKSGNAVDGIKEALNTNGKVNVSFTEAVMDANHQALPRNIQFKKGVSKIFKHNDAFVVVKVNNILPKTLKTFDESKGKVISDYQVFKEENWLKQLASKYTVKVNQDVLKAVKQQIKKQ